MITINKNKKEIISNGAYLLFIRENEDSKLEIVKGYYYIETDGFSIPSRPFLYKNDPIIKGFLYLKEVEDFLN